MKKDKSVTVGFICSNTNLMKALDDNETRLKIDYLIDKYYKLGYRKFISGLDPGYDFIAAMAVGEKKKDPRYRGLELWIYLTHKDQNEMSGKTANEVEDQILSMADNISVAADYGFPGFRYIRDEYIVKDSSVILYIEGSSGSDNETANSLEYASKTKTPMVSIKDVKIEA